MRASFPWSTRLTIHVSLVPRRSTRRRRQHPLFERRLQGGHYAGHLRSKRLRNGNEAEDFAEVSRVYASQILLKDNLDTTQCMKNQLEYLAQTPTTNAAYLTSKSCDLTVRQKMEDSIAGSQNKSSVQSKFWRWPVFPSEVADGINNLKPLAGVSKTEDTDKCRSTSAACGAIEGKLVYFDDCPSTGVLMCRCSGSPFAWEQFQKYVNATSKRSKSLNFNVCSKIASIPSGLRQIWGRINMNEGDKGHLTGQFEGKGELQFGGNEPLCVGLVV